MAKTLFAMLRYGLRPVSFFCRKETAGVLDKPNAPHKGTAKPKKNRETSQGTVGICSIFGFFTKNWSHFSPKRKKKVIYFFRYVYYNI